MLEISAIECYYGKVRVVKGVSFTVAASEVLALLGRNGAGKTTTLKAVMGLVACPAGSIRVGGAELLRRPPHLIPRLGVGYVPQGRRLFAELSVAENLRMGVLAGRGRSEPLDAVLELFPILRQRMRQAAGTLSGGEQQMLAMGRALCLEPKVLLLDEPCEGLQPSFVQKVLDTIALLKRQGVALLLVEQKVEVALAVADRVAFLENGSVVHQGAAALARDRTLLERYVGVRR